LGVGQIESTGRRDAIDGEAANGMIDVVTDMPRRNGPGIELLADPTRRRIVGLLAVRALRPSTIATEIGLSRPATSRQLKLLQEAGLVVAAQSMADRRAILYRLDPKAHGPITAWLAGTGVARPIRLSVEDDGRLVHG
jgi:DNA-binding transcriptional ArsR family regulator